MRDTQTPRRNPKTGKRQWRMRRAGVWLMPVIWTVGVVLVLTVGLWLEIRGKVTLKSKRSTPLFEDRRGVFLAESADQRLGFWDVPEAIPEKIEACVLAIEDHRFVDHCGVDVRALMRALINNISGGPRQGGSTIAMQVARMQNPGPRTYWRKVSEIVTARLLVRRYGRRAVLRHYLKIVPQGNRMHGVAYASRRYFQKPLEDLGWAEAALLAGLAQAPGRFNLYRPLGRANAKLRAHRVLERVRDLGWMSRHDFEAGVSTLKGLNVPDKEIRPFQATHAILRMQAIAGDSAGANRPVRTRLDLELQRAVDQKAHAVIERYRPLGAGNIAVIVAEVESGGILAYLGSDFYCDEDHAGAINFANTKRSSGSTIKPFIFAHGLESGKYTPGSILPDLPLHLTHPSGHYSVDNFDSSFLGPLLYRRALATSRNVPAVQVVRTVGLDKVYRDLARLGLADPRGDPSHFGLGLAIGGLYVTLEDLVTAYGVLANGGRSYCLSFFQESRQTAGSVQVIEEDVARLITLFLSDPNARLPVFPRGGSLEFPFPVAVKTGTSQGFRDAWCVAFSDTYLVGVWMGHADAQRMNHVSGAAAAGLVRDILTLLHPLQPQGVDQGRFSAPAGYHRVRICPLSGELAGEHCSTIVHEFFDPGSRPTRVCRVHRELAIDTMTGGLADAFSSPKHVSRRVFVALDPRYSVWCANHDLDPPPQSHRKPTRQAQISIQSPKSGSRLILDPQTPLQFQSVALRAEVTPNVPEVIWVVDGRAFAEVSYPYATRWPLTPGHHTFQVRFPQAAVTSRAVTIFVSR